MNYGVVVQSKDGEISVYNNLIIKSSEKQLMVKVDKLCSLLGLSYQYNNSTKKLVIKNGKTKDSWTFLLGSRKYTFYSSDVSRTYQLETISHFSYDKSSKCYLIQYDSLSDIFYTTSDKVSGDNYFAKIGYQGIITYSKGTLDLKTASIDEMADKIVKEIIEDDMTDLEKVYAINKYMAEHFEYDYSYTYYYPYEFMTYGSGVCNAYALTFKLFMDKIGITCQVVTGTADGLYYGRHAWNIVKLGDNYYNVDVTWNDGTGNKYLLVTDKQLSKDHYWIKEDYPKCNKKIAVSIDKTSYIMDDYLIYYEISGDGKKYCTYDFKKIKYDGSDQQDIITFKINDEVPIGYEYESFDPFVFDGEWMYYLCEANGTTFNRINLKTNVVEKVFRNPNLYEGCHDFFMIIDGWVYFCNYSTVYRINLNTEERQDLYHFGEGSEDVIRKITDTGDGIEIWCYSYHYYLMNYDGSNFKEEIIQE